MKDLISLVNEFQDWALFDGKYSVSTIKRDSRKIRELSNSFNILAPTQEDVFTLDFTLLSLISLGKCLP